MATLIKSCPWLEELVLKFIGNYAVDDGVDNNLVNGFDPFEDGVWLEGTQHHGTQDAGSSGPKPGLPISDALDIVLGTRRTLDITGCGCVSYLYRQAPGEEKCLPRDFRILSLPRLQNLEYLTIDL